MQSLNISIPSEAKNLALLENFIESFTTAFSLPDNLSARINLSMNEAYTNCVQRANGKDITPTIDIYAKKEENQFEIILNDKGASFDYSIIPDPTIPENIEEESKRGLFLMKELSDELIFERGGSRIIMKFNLPKHDFLSRLLKYLRSTKLSELIRKDVLTTRQLEISIPCKLNHFGEIEDFVYTLPNQLHLRGILFYRIAVVILEVVDRIMIEAHRDHRKVDEDIKVLVKKMKTKIKVTISYGEKQYPKPMQNVSPYYSKHYTNKFSLSKKENKIELFFDRWTKKNLQRYL